MNSDDKWRGIWNNKSIPTKEIIDLKILINLNGFDSAAGLLGEDSWRTIVADFCERTKISQFDNVLELGCGSGAFLYAANEYVKANWYGVDYSAKLIDMAQKAIPSGKFIVDEVINSNFEPIYFDVIFSHSVFQYFKSIKYAEKVLQLWCSKLKSDGKLVLLDINDVEFETIYHEDRAKQFENPDDYLKSYSGLKHLFFDKKHLSELLVKYGMKDVRFFPHATSNYGNQKYRFNIICSKKC